MASRRCALGLRSEHFDRWHPEQAADFDFAKLIQRTNADATPWKRFRRSTDEADDADDGKEQEEEGEEGEL